MDALSLTSVDPATLVIISVFIMPKGFSPSMVLCLNSAKVLRFAAGGKIVYLSEVWCFKPR
jgi:hypothetical protein